MSKLRHGESQSPIGSLVQQISAQLKRDGDSIVQKKTAAMAAGLESLDAASLREVQSAATHIETSFKDLAYGIEGFDSSSITAAGLEAATIIGLASADPKTYLRAKRTGVGIEGIPVITNPVGGSFGSIDYANAGLEAFDKANIENFVAHSIAYNLLAPRQDEFGETFFPTIVATPDQAYFKVSVNRTMVYEGAIHKLDASLADFNKRNIIEAFRDAEILKNEATELVPYVQASGVNASIFVDEALVPTYQRKVDKHDVDTRPLRINNPTPISLIGASQHPGLISAGLLDQTDAVDHMVKLSTLYVRVTKGSDSSIVKFNTVRMPRSQFIKTREGMSKDVGLQFRTQGLRVDENTKAIDGAAVPALADVVAGKFIVNLRGAVDGDLNLERGELSVRAGHFTPFSVFDENGVELSVAHPALAGVTFEPIGYEVSARRTNSNRRVRGLLLDRDIYEEAYLVGVLPPISIHKAVAHDDEAADVQALINATHVQISNSAVTNLLNYAEALESFYNSAVVGTSTAPSTGGDFAGIARMMVTPFFERIEVDLEKVVANISSKDKLKDIQGFFVALINEISYRMSQKSGYVPALQALTAGAKAKPRLLIGTDVVLPQFMMIPGDDRISGPAMDHDIVSTLDKRMEGKIVLTFGTKGEGFQELNFGNMIWVPELVSEVPVNRNGATISETMVQPRFLHICNLPVMAIIDVKNLDAITKQRVRLDVNHYTVTP